jgi:preprotein translocase subunit SecD
VYRISGFFAFLALVFNLLLVVLLLSLLGATLTLPGIAGMVFDFKLQGFDYKTSAKV